MQTKLLKVALDPDRAVAEAAEILRAGGLVAFPTETVYGLGALGLDPAAVERIFEAKGRPLSDPMILHVADPSWLPSLVTEVHPLAAKLVERFWPGPLTLVLPKAPQVPEMVTAGGDSVALRMPAHPIALDLLRRVGAPVAAPSANLFSRPSPTTAEHVLQDLDGRIDAILDAGPTSVGVESTVLDVRQSPPVILRPGGLSRERIEKALGVRCAILGAEAVQRFAGDPRPADADGPRHATSGGSAETVTQAASPGLLTKHYSPRAEVLLFDGDREAVIAAMRRAASERTSTAILAFTEDTPRFRDLGVLLAALGERGRLDEVAKRLYALFRELDARGIQRIVMCMAPAEGLGAAINDRLVRAASGRVRHAEATPEHEVGLTSQSGGKQIILEPRPHQE